MQDSLPSGWISADLQSVAAIIMGQSPPSTSYNSNGKGLPFFQGKAEFGDVFPTPVKFCLHPLKIAEAEDVLISVRAPVGPTNLAREKSCIGRGLAAIRPYHGTLSRYLFYFLRRIESWLSTQGTGSTFTAIGKQVLEELIIPIAPLREQCRIVAKLEKLLEKVEASQKRLERIPVILKRFRQSVLAAACSGRLTEDWRGENDPENSYNGIIAEGSPYDIPDRWVWVELRYLADGFQYGTSSKSSGQGKVAVLRMGNLQNGTIDWSDLKYSSDDEEIRKYRLKEGDVLFNRTNSPELVGKTSIYDGEREAIFAGYLIRIKYKKEFLNSDYLNYCLNTSRAKEWCNQVKTDGVSQSNINAQILSTFLVPLPPITEQQEIVRRVEAMFSLSDKIESRYKKAKAQVDKLAQSILAKAFRGELVPQDPKDEPVSMLVERIKQEKQTATDHGRKRRLPTNHH